MGACGSSITLTAPTRPAFLHLVLVLVSFSNRHDNTAGDDIWWRYLVSVAFVVCGFMSVRAAESDIGAILSLRADSNAGLLLMTLIVSSAIPRMISF